ncbi:MAG: entericidin A/B family lipoprotein [Betaproteobacteria bacterium]
MFVGRLHKRCNFGGATECSGIFGHLITENRTGAKTMKNVSALIVAAALGFTLAGCNTISGAGKDVAAGGEKIQEASAKVRGEWHAWRMRHDSDYDSARTGCASGSDAQRDACRDRARAEYRARMDEARMKYHRAEMRASSDAERMEDAYESARDACYSMRGSDEDRCIADARAKYHRG